MKTGMVLGARKGMQQAWGFICIPTRIGMVLGAREGMREGMGLHPCPYEDRNVRTVASIKRVPLGKFPVKPWD